MTVLDFAGSVMVCLRYRSQLKTDKSWFETFLACILMQFGGTTLTGLLLGQPPSWVISNRGGAFFAFFFAWYLTFFSPFDMYWKAISSMSMQLPLRMIGFVSAISSGHAVTSWGLDKAAIPEKAFHVNPTRISQSALICILCGTFSGCGGGLLCDWFGFLRMPSFVLTKSPSMFNIGDYSSTATLNKSFLLAVLYYLLLNCHIYLSIEAPLVSMPRGRLIICLLQVTDFLVKLWYPTTDIFQYISNSILRLMGIKPVVKAALDDSEEKVDKSTTSKVKLSGKKDGKKTKKNQ